MHAPGSLRREQGMSLGWEPCLVLFSSCSGEPTLMELARQSQTLPW